jgi:hypothetical protein
MSLSKPGRDRDIATHQHHTVMPYIFFTTSPCAVIGLKLVPFVPCEISEPVDENGEPYHHGIEAYL